MSPHVYIPLILLLSAGCALAAPEPRVGEAEVRESGSGLPCFTISEREERRSGAPSFEAVTVYDASARQRTRMWTMSMPANRTFPVMFTMCVPYGGRVQSLPQTAALALETGKVYEVQIDVRASALPDQPRGYGARFCMARQRDGSAVVHRIGAGDQPGRNLYGCLSPK